VPELDANVGATTVWRQETIKECAATPQGQVVALMIIIL
jgi:hypothetical protein